MDRQILIDHLAELEWDAFQEVQDINGRVDCQDNRREFDINRKSQFASWNDGMLENYLEDLEIARRNRRNLVWEKYARMMEFTSPLEYPNVVDRLPQLSDTVKKLTGQIIKEQVALQEELANTYPKLFAHSRRIRSEEDTPLDSSFETYLRCELLTYSEAMLLCYLAHLKDCEQKGSSMNRICMEEMVKQYGYASLETAEASM
jgi:hypothetical protein